MDIVKFALLEDMKSKCKVLRFLLQSFRYTSVEMNKKKKRMLIRKQMFLGILALLTTFSCASTGNTLNEKIAVKETEVVLESGVKVVIKHKDVLPMTVHYKNKTFKIYLDRQGKIAVKSTGIDRQEPPSGNY